MNVQMPLVIAVALVGFLLPFFLNVRLAHSRKRSLVWILLLTVLFHWIVTFALLLLPPVSEEHEPSQPS
jgi:hypothetical protein